MVHQINIDFAKLEGIVAISVRRASIFMGIAANAGRIDPPISHVLDDKAQFKFIADDAPLAARREMVDAFNTWVIANGLREMIESFSIFLGECFLIRHLIAEQEFPDAVAKKRFERLGVEDQLASLSGDLPIDERFFTMFGSLNQARNCLAHRRGVIGVADVPTPGLPFVLRWRTRTITLEDGRDVAQLLVAGEEIKVEAGENIRSEEVERTKTYAIGEAIILSRHELSEICLGITIATAAIRLRLYEFAKERGVQDAPQPDAEPAT